jgi:uncharacterized protein (TIGR02687 family)
MAESSLEKIRLSLNSHFSAPERRIVFWLDPNREWQDRLSDLALSNTKLLTLTEKNSFRVKYTLEVEDKASNYLVYTQLPKSWFLNSHLTDTYLYSKPFIADAISILAGELGVKDEAAIDAMHRYSSWLLDSENQKQLSSLNYQDYRKETLPLAIMCAICGASVDLNILLVKIISAGLKDNLYFKQFAENKLLDEFWAYYKKWFAWQEDTPSLEKLIISLYISSFHNSINSDNALPESWKSKFIGRNGLGNTSIFFDHLRLKFDDYSKLAEYVSGEIKLKDLIKDIPLNALIGTAMFREVDKNIISWIIKRLVMNDTGAKLADRSIEEIISSRLGKEYASMFESEYQLLLSAYRFLSLHIDKYPETLPAFIRQYADDYFRFDFYYREFITSFNALFHSDKYEKLQELIENTYTTNFLSVCLPEWNNVYAVQFAEDDIARTRNFYRNYIKNTDEKAKTAVIISDALRYEIAVELFNELEKDQNYTVSIEPSLGILPSVTSIGMAALLPQKALDIMPDGSAFCDNKSIVDLQKRQSILQSADTESGCIQYNDLIQKNSRERRDVFTGKNTVYIYHNQIDARGEQAQTENEVFAACKEAVKEINELLKRLSTGANIYRFIITADHGFIYKRNKITESDKISILSSATGLKERRFFITDHQVKDDGILSLLLGKLYNNDNQNFVVFPVSANVFRTPGGQNYVHGGSSPQELIVPVITVKAERYHVETRKAAIKPIGVAPIRVNTVNPSFQFIQSEPISDKIKEETYKICIIDSYEKAISDEQEYAASSKDSDPKKRMFFKSFLLKNQKYSSKESYYLVIKSVTFELSRTLVSIDIPFADDFGFL